MASIDKFEDLVAWQKARQLSKSVYLLTRSERFARDFALVDQMRRAAISVCSNLAEGFERTSRPDVVHFITLAKSSCAEIRAQLYLALDIGHLDQPSFDALAKQADEVARIIGGLRASLLRLPPSVRPALPRRTRNPTVD